MKQQLPQQIATQLYVVCLEMSVIQTRYTMEEKKMYYYFILYPSS